MSDKKEKIVLAYSGGLDTTAIIPWLKENYDYEVICACIDCGQAEELDGLEQRALSTGASKLYIVNVIDELCDDYIMPCVKAGAVYENKYLNTSLVKYSNVAKKILKISENAYKSANVNKWRLKNQGAQPTLRDAETGEEISYKDYIEKITEGLLDEDESILLLSEVFDLFLLNKDKNKDLTDRTAIVKEIGDKQAMAYNIPLDVFYGTKTEKSNGNNDLITFGCEPCMKTIEDTINGGLIEEKDYLKGERVTFNRFCMQHLDITTLGTSLDKLTAIGFSFNQICRMLNLPEVDEDWANEHHVTKNYADVKGGVIDG